MKKDRKSLVKPKFTKSLDRSSQASLFLILNIHACPVIEGPKSSPPLAKVGSLRKVEAMVTVATYSKPEDAYLAASMLEGNGVPATVRDAEMVSLNWTFSNAIGGVKVDVADEDLEQARELLALARESEGILCCPHCGSHDVRMRELSLWSMIGYFLFGAFIPAKNRDVDCMNCKKSFEYKKHI